MGFGEYRGFAAWKIPTPSSGLIALLMEFRLGQGSENHRWNGVAHQRATESGNSSRMRSLGKSPDSPADHTGTVEASGLGDENKHD